MAVPWSACATPNSGFMRVVTPSTGCSSGVTDLERPGLSARAFLDARLSRNETGPSRGQLAQQSIDLLFVQAYRLRCSQTLSLVRSMSGPVWPSKGCG
jgi:hypothetical protein